MGFTKTTATVKSAVNDWIINHPHVIVLPITNECAKINFRGKMKISLFLKKYGKFLSDISIIIWYRLCHKVGYNKQ